MKQINDKNFIEVVAVVAASGEVTTDPTVAVMWIESGGTVVDREDAQLASIVLSRNVSKLPVLMYYCKSDRAILSVADLECKYILNGVPVTAAGLVKAAKAFKHVKTTSEASAVLRANGKKVGLNKELVE